MKPAHRIRIATVCLGLGIASAGCHTAASVTPSAGKADLAAPKPLSLCLKAYSDAETQTQLAACPRLSDALNTLSNDQMKFQTTCVSGSRVFYELGCGIYDVAITGTVALPDGAAGTTIPFNQCFKAYSDAETVQAKVQCDELASALSSIASDVLGEVSCTVGPDSFYKDGCGIYDAAMTGQLTLK